MPPLTLEGDTLGTKHKHFNKLVQDATTKKQFELTKINYDNGDIDNLLKIDIASNTKNIDFIIHVLKCDDMLYISRAIKQSTWLIKEQEYAHIIHPEYLYTQLFPHMLTKAVSKLLLHIRLHLKDENRAEAFYDYCKHISDDANKWLLTCSIPFAEKAIQNTSNISLQLYKRLCKRSVVFLKFSSKVENCCGWQVLKEVIFLIKLNTEEYLNYVETLQNYQFPSLGKKYTEYVMKKCPNRILNNFEKYMHMVELSMVAKNMKKEDIKEFLLQSRNNDNMKNFFSNYENLKHFVKNIPNEERFEFIKKTFIEKIETAPASSGELGASFSACPPRPSNIAPYRWYKYAPFNVAFMELKKIIRAESSPSERCAMLSLLIECARNNPQHTKTLLQHYYDKHRNEPFKFKIQFANNVVTKMPVHKFDSETWTILNNLFHSMEVYIDSGNDVQICLKSIVLYKVLHDEDVPNIVEKKITFHTFKEFQSKLNDEQQSKIFSYLLSSVSNKIQNITITTELDFKSVLNLIHDAMNLLLDWKKDIKESIFLHEKIKQLIQINKQNAWDIDLSSLYNKNKSWRRQMFEESLILSPNEEVCLNALKHEPQLLVRYSDEVEALRIKDNIPLHRLLTRLRVYWPHSLAQKWIGAYINDIYNSTGRGGLVKYLFVLLSVKEITELAKKHIPSDYKIEWGNIDETELSLRKNIAKHLHIARPLASLDAVLWYAKGDYLQFTVPSLNAILHNISTVQSRDYIPKLLDAPVSVQKYGLHLAFIKLKYEDLISIFTNIWKTTKNSTIRTHLFTYTYKLLCKENELSVANDLWTLLSTFIDTLTPDENMAIFSNLGKPRNVHISVRGQFFMKSYNFLSSLPASANCEKYINNLESSASNIMHLLDADFVADKILAPIEEKISHRDIQFIEILSSYVLHGKTEEEQCERYKRTLVPALKYAFTSWDMIKNDEYVMRSNIDSLINSLTCDFIRFICKKTIVVPVTLFSEIQTFMEQNLPIDDNYEKYTTWKLTTEYVKLVAEYKDALDDLNLEHIKECEFDRRWLPDDAERIWETLHIQISPKFGHIIVEHLKKDTERYFPSICWMFSFALSNVFSNLSFNKNLMKMETLKHMVLDQNFVPSFIVACEEIPKYGDDEDKKKRSEIRKILSAHPSKEVQMYYQRNFANIVD